MKNNYLPSMKAIVAAGILCWSGITGLLAQPSDPPDGHSLSQTLQAIETHLQDRLTNEGFRKPLDTPIPVNEISIANNCFY